MTGPKLHFRFRPGVGLEAKYAEDADLPHNWRKSLLPHVDACSNDDLRAMIAARDGVVSVAEGAK